ncbi:AMP-binding protein [Rhodococcus sp. SJ-3]|uniref:amino acid adenylation domain-containing protein n=1 Tax=Rhodococcus sp. SJ-3 TaxID=3454628 RepID=UPI003F7AABEB
MHTVRETTGDVLNEVLFERNWPEAGWVGDSNTSCDQDEFVRSVRTTATRLQQEFTPQHDIVLITARRDLATLTVLLGCVHAGIVFVPLDRATPEERVREIAVASGARAVVTDRDDLSVLDLHRVSAFVAPTKHPPASPAPFTGDLLCLLFTSGSTGAPKGVACTRSGFADRMNHDVLGGPDYNVGPGDTVAARASFSFTMSLAEIFTALRHRMNLYVASDAAIRNPPRLVEEIRAHNGTVVLSVPSLLEAMIRSNGSLPQSLRIAVVGGEPCSQWLTDALGEEQSTVRIVHTYGNTETSANVYYAESLTMLGEPLPGMTGFVLGDDLVPVGAGGVGELYLAGAQLAVGYFGQVGLTAERFVPCPFGSGEVMFRTGDLVRVGLDGGFSYVGRSDFQLNVRGHRVEPGEIEFVAVGLPGVERCVVVERGVGSASLMVAFVTADAGVEVCPDRVRAEIGARLPDYMVPNRVVVVDTIPLTTSGKVDRRALGEVPLDGDRAAGAGVAGAGSDVERVVCEVFGEVLQCGEVGPSDDFFELGGHSLAALAVSEAISARTGRYLEPTAIFAARTPAGLSALLTDDAHLGTGEQEVAPPAANRMSEAELSMWFTQRYRNTNGAFNLWYYGQVSGRLEAKRLLRAFDRVLAVHPNLRSLVTEDFDGPHKQVVEADRIAASDYLRIVPRRLPDSEIITMIHQNFDFESDLPIRVVLFTDRDDLVDRVLVVVNHVAADGASMPVLIDTVRAELEGAGATTAAAVLAQLPGEHPASEADRTFWTRYLAEVGPSPAGARRRTEPRSYVGEAITVPINRSRVDELSRIADAVGGSLFTVLHGAVAMTLASRGLGTSSLATVPIENRHSSGDRQVVGMLANNLLLKAALDDRETVGGNLRTLADADIEAFGHQRYPFEQAVRILRETQHLDETETASPLAIALQNNYQDYLEIGDVELRRIVLPTTRCPYDLYFNFIQHAEHDAGITLELQYAADLYDRTTIDDMVEAFLKCASMTLDDLKTPTSTFMEVVR